MSILSIAYSGLSAFQRALDVTGNNIANMRTRGYTRQTIQFSTGFSTRYGNSFIGNGVNVGSIFRNADQFANAQVRSTTSTQSQYDVFYQQAIQVDKLLSQDGGNISKSLQSFFDAFSSLNSTPDSAATRNITFIQSQNLVNQFNFLQSRLDEYQSDSSLQITQVANQINQLTSSIADINARVTASGGAPDLLDKRDSLLEELAGLVDISVVDQENGMVNVSMKSGEMLVAGAGKCDLSVGFDQFSHGGTKVYLVNGTGGQIDITAKIHSGKIGGLLDYEHDVVGKASQLIGQMAIGLSQKFNAQHVLGMDMNNQIGKNFFNDFNSMTDQLNRVIAPTTNTGTAVLSVEISDISQTKLSDYDMVISNTATNELRLIRKSDGSSTTLNWSSNPPAPPGGQVVFDGMTIRVDDLSRLDNTDKFSLIPTRNAARGLSLNIGSGSEIAMASPVKVSASLSNTGNGAIALGPILNTNLVNKEFRIDFISDTQFNIVNVTDSSSTGPFVFTPNSNNEVPIPDAITPSYSIVLSGIPKSGDQFNANFNAGGYGDNRNGLGLLSTQQSKFFSSGTESLSDRFGMLLSDVGSQTKQAETSVKSAAVLLQQAMDMQQGISGVNPDEEAANLLKLEQAYAAAGKLVEVSSQMMNILFEMLR